MKQTQPDCVYPRFQQIRTSHLTLTDYDQIWHNQVLGDVGTVYALASNTSKIKSKNLQILAVLASKESERRREQSGKGAKGLRTRAKNVICAMVDFWKPSEHDERTYCRVAERQDRLEAHMNESELNAQVVQVNTADSSISIIGYEAEALGGSRGCDVKLPRAVKVQPESGPSHRNEAQLQEQEYGIPMQWQWCPLRRVPTDICVVEHTDDSTRNSRQIRFIWPAHITTEQSNYPTHEPTFRTWLEKTITEKFHIPGPEQHIEVEFVSKQGWMHAEDWVEIHDHVWRLWPPTSTTWTIRVSRNSNKPGRNMAVTSDGFRLRGQPSGVDEEGRRVAPDEPDSMDVSDTETRTTFIKNESDASSQGESGVDFESDSIDSESDEEAEEESEVDSDSDYIDSGSDEEPEEEY